MQGLLSLCTLLAAPLPGVLIWHESITLCSAPSPTRSKAGVWWWCKLYNSSPVAAANIVFLLNVCIGFWIISLCQQSTWLIDPYWTLIPPLVALAYYSHPAAKLDTRCYVAYGLLLIWSLRLTHSYFRREEWHLGRREDWRFANMRKKYGWHWWWLSFFAVYISQQLMLMGITLPLYSISSSGSNNSRPWQPVWDTVAALICIAGITIAGIADTQLYRFSEAQKRVRQQKGETDLMLTSGLWRFSRHPNYFGEQLFWWGLALFAIIVGHPWAVVGTLFNSICMVEVTWLTEARMLANPKRRAAYTTYQRSTSPWIPLLPRGR